MQKLSAQGRCGSQTNQGAFYHYIDSGAAVARFIRSICDIKCRIHTGIPNIFPGI